MIMHVIIYFSLIILLILRVVGSVVSMYSRQKVFHPKLFAVGWMLWALAAIFPLLTLWIKDRFLSELFLVTNVLFSSVGLIFLCWGFLLVFFQISKRVFLILITSTVIIAYFLFLTVGAGYAIFVTSLFLNAVWLYSLLTPLIKRKALREVVDKSIMSHVYVILLMVFNYFPLGVYAYMRGFSYGLYDADDVLLIFLHYGWLIISTFLLILLSAHLEYRITFTQKFDLKDKFSHNLGNALHSIFNSMTLLDNREITEEERVEIRELLEEKEKEATELLGEIREL